MSQEPPNYDYREPYMNSLKLDSNEEDMTESPSEGDFTDDGHDTEGTTTGNVLVDILTEESTTGTTLDGDGETTTLSPSDDPVIEHIKSQFEDSRQEEEDYLENEKERGDNGHDIDKKELPTVPINFHEIGEGEGRAGTKDASSIETRRKSIDRSDRSKCRRRKKTGSGGSFHGSEYGHGSRHEKRYEVDTSKPDEITISTHEGDESCKVQININIVSGGYPGHGHPGSGSGYGEDNYLGTGSKDSFHGDYEDEQCIEGDSSHEGKYGEDSEDSEDHSGGEGKYGHDSEHGSSEGKHSGEGDSYSEEEFKYEGKDSEEIGGYNQDGHDYTSSEEYTTEGQKQTNGYGSDEAHFDEENSFSGEGYEGEKGESREDNGYGSKQRESNEEEGNWSEGQAHYSKEDVSYGKSSGEKRSGEGKDEGKYTEGDEAETFSEEHDEDEGKINGEGEGHETSSTEEGYGKSSIEGGYSKSSSEGSGQEHYGSGSGSGSYERTKYSNKTRHYGKKVHKYTFSGGGGGSGSYHGEGGTGTGSESNERRRLCFQEKEIVHHITEVVVENMIHEVHLEKEVITNEILQRIKEVYKQPKYSFSS